MNHCIRLLLLFALSLVALGLLGIAFATNWWTVTLERYIPNERSLQVSNHTHFHWTLIPITISHGLFTERIAYRNVKVLVSNSFDFRAKLPHERTITLANENCTNNQFTCQTGLAILRPFTRCIDKRQKCNHIVDCEDKSDETSCDVQHNTYDNQFFHCPTGYTKCEDGRSCYRRYEQTCDGVFNCIDESDERNCNIEKCQDKKRVYCLKEDRCARREHSERCDGIVDCADYSDEFDCSQCSSKSSFRCDSKCFDENYRCDGIIHCSDLRDEVDCNDDKTILNKQGRDFNNMPYLEKNFNPFRLHTFKDTSFQYYLYPIKRMEYLNLVHRLKLIVFYGIVSGLIFLLFAVISLFFFGCCRHHCISIPFYFYGFWMLLAWLVISISLLIFVFLWLWQKQIVLDPEKTLLIDVMIHENNPSLRHIEFLGLSFWLACGALLATFIGLLLSYWACCTVGSSRAEDKEYEIMHMQSY